MGDAGVEGWAGQWSCPASPAPLLQARPSTAAVTEAAEPPQGDINLDPVVCSARFLTHLDSH